MEKLIPDGYPNLPSDFTVIGIYLDETKNVYVRVSRSCNVLLTEHWDGFSADPVYIRFDVLLDKVCSSTS